MAEARHGEPIFPKPPFRADEYPAEREGRPRTIEDEALAALREVEDGGRLYSLDEVLAAAPRSNRNASESHDEALNLPIPKAVPRPSPEEG